ncbi:MAG: efflux RND transporter periplasmic adaptor subunit [Acidobacteriota bacterium]
MGAKRPDLSELRIDENLRAESGSSRRWLWPVLGASLLLLAIAAALGLRGRPIEVTVAAVRPAGDRVASTVLNASGYVTPRRRATVAAKITGRVAEMLVEEGMRVEAGQVLAKLDDAEARKRLAAARAAQAVARAAIAEVDVQLGDAERTLGRTMDLRKEAIASASDLDHAVAAVDSLRARLVLAREQVRAAETQVDVARQDVENCTVRAPFVGIAVSKDAQVGEMVSPVSAGGGFTRTGISTIVDMASLEIEVDVNESYIARVQPGQVVEATLDAYPEWRIPAKVRTVIPTADRQKATVKVRIAFGALDERILPDMGVKVAFLKPTTSAAESAAPAPLMPRAAARDDAGQPVVFLVRNGRLERRAVRLGEVRGADIEVLAGLAEGDQVVVAGPAELRDGQRVRVK